MNTFDDLKEVIELGLKNQMPRDARLIVVGRISYAVERGELTLAQSNELQSMLGNPQEWQDAFRMALSGSLSNSADRLST